jgi:hypothetical protein
MNELIGTTAGQVWEYLSNNDEVTMTALKKDLSLKTDEATMALGWLAREDKINFNKKGSTMKVSLK